jgi:hypothetical protein
MKEGRAENSFISEEEIGTEGDEERHREQHSFLINNFSNPHLSTSEFPQLTPLSLSLALQPAMWKKFLLEFSEK